MKSASETCHVSEADELEWLKRQAENIVHQTIAVAVPPFPENEIDEVYMHHRAVLHMGFLYNNLRGAIRLENGPEIFRMWRFWLLHLLGGHRVNYANEAANFIANVAADWPIDIANTHVNFRTVNMTGTVGEGKPIDELIEHYNL